MNHKIFFNLLKALLFLSILVQYFAIFNNFYLLSAFTASNYSKLLLIVSSVFCFFAISNILVRISSLIVCIGNLIIFYFNPYILQLQVAYINFILICIFLFSSGPLFGIGSFFKRQHFALTYWKKYVHILFSVSLFTSGISKLRLSFWQEGTALWYLCSNNIFLQEACDMPIIFFKVITFIVLFAEIFSIFVLFEKVRKYVFLMQVTLFLGISTSVLHIGVYTLICFLFLIEESWLPRFKERNT